MSKFIKDILMEDKNDNKYSSKKIAGLLGALLAFLAFIIDGFHFYDINDHMFDSILLFAATMLGVSVIRNFAGSTRNKDTEDATKE